MAQGIKLSSIVTAVIFPAVFIVRTVFAQVIINEVDADTPGTDMLEFVELYDGGVGNSGLSGLVLVFFNGNGDVSYRAIDLDGRSTDANGFFVLGNAGVANVELTFANGTLQNGPDAVALYSGDASDFPNGTSVTTNNLLDAIVYDTNDPDDPGLLVLLNSGQRQVNEGAVGDKDGHSNQRFPNGSGGARNTNSYNQFPPTPGAPNVGSGETENAAIFRIQGAGLSSPLQNKSVVTENNVVTAVTVKGFFMQSPADRVDTDPETSEGLFVFTGGTPAVAVGDLVNVTGRVIEFSGMTEITDNPSVTIVSSNVPLPAPIEFDSTLPSPDQPQPANEFERYEGMLIILSAGSVAAPSDEFGDVKIVASPNRPFREPGIAFPGLPGLPTWDGNPEIFSLDPDGVNLPDLQIPAGIEITFAQGPLAFNFGNYQLVPTALSLVGSTAPRPVRAPDELEATIATQNLFRLFDDQDDPDLDDPVPTAEEYATKLMKLSRQIRDVLRAPDILAVQEVENLNALQDLTEQIAADDPAILYTPILQEGNDIGGIDVGFLVRNSVKVNSVTQIGKNATFDFAGEARTLFDRPPLLVDAIIDTTGTMNVKVMVIHNRSLSGIEGKDSTRVRLKRFEQARWLSQEIQQLQNADPSLKLVVLGDFNAYQFTDGYVDVLGQITGSLDPAGAQIVGTDEVEPDLENQVLALPPEERYSFIFKGSA
ncbi:MAG: endonuclease/exonuclease/phosphatase family protein, partial [bacterium]